MSDLIEHAPYAPEEQVGRVSSQACIRLVTKKVKIGAPLGLWAHRPTENAFVLSNEESDAAGFGEVEVLSADGPSRLLRIRKMAEALFARLTLDGPEGAPSPRLYGGMSFQPGAATSPPWQGFGDARFVLPRIRYVRRGGSAWLSVAMRAGESDRSVALELEAAQEALARPIAPGPRTPVRAVEQLEEFRFRDLVRAAQTAIDAGEIEKIVLARVARVTTEQPIEVGAVLSAIFSEPSTRFAIRVGGATFAGATPERLVTRHGRRVLTEALAGTIAAKGWTRVPEEDAAQTLFARAKDREEHAIVVRHIQAVLEPLCTMLRVPKEPAARSLGHLLHLHTPIEGELRTDTHLLSLAKALHPTPAVGGAPSEAAVSLLRKLEPVPRGWYAAPIGWFDEAGDGELYVGLRSGVIDESSALIYAGAGIVRDSDPAAEYAETALKQRVFGRALGL